MRSVKTQRISRRSVLTGLAGATGVAFLRAAGFGTVQTAAQTLPATDDPTKVLGPWSTDVGARSPHVQLGRKGAGNTYSLAPLQDLHGTITPADLHFERHHAGVPAIDPDRHEVVIHGMVDRPTVFSVADLMRFPAASRICFLECSGNLYRDAPEDATPQDICGLTSQSEWTGVMLSTLFREVGVRRTATWFLAEGSDAAVMTRSLPVEKAWDDAMVAYAQNGEPIRPENGYPVRLLMPGWEGNTSIKWLRRIELADRPFMSREETSKYTEPLKGNRARQFSFVMDARSIITFPSYPKTIERGWIEIQGLAWSGRGRIQRVDVSTDGGRIWQPAALQAPVLPKAHTRFRLLWRWDGRETEIMSRAVDETGYVQPTRAALIAARGVGAVPYHLNPITAWRVRRSGEVVYRVEDWA